LVIPAKLGKLPGMGIRIFIIHFAVLGVLLTPLSARAENPPAAEWTCDIKAELNGVPNSFLYNKDSWEGSGILSCMRSNEILEEPITVQYEGWASATGLAGKSRLLMFSYFVPTLHPDEILRSFPTTSLSNEPSVYYNFPVTTVLQVGRIRAFEMGVQASQAHENLEVPLNLGTLSIRKKTP
jgi:hypothetical protein